MGEAILTRRGGGKGIKDLKDSAINKIYPNMSLSMDGVLSGQDRTDIRNTLITNIFSGELIQTINRSNVAHFANTSYILESYNGEMTLMDISGTQIWSKAETLLGASSEYASTVGMVIDDKNEYMYVCYTNSPRIAKIKLSDGSLVWTKSLSAGGALAYYDDLIFIHSNKTSGFASFQQYVDSSSGVIKNFSFVPILLYYGGGYVK